MSYCKKEGKDTIIFATEEDHNQPSSVPFPEADEDDKPVGVILSNGDINWGCPCLGGMATGPCGVQFREAFSCFHFSDADPKGSDCLEPFRTMSGCMSNYPGVYGSKEDDTDPLSESLEASENETSQSSNSTNNKEISSDGSSTNSTNKSGDSGLTKDDLSPPVIPVSSTADNTVKVASS